jgi:dihydrofolate reductase
MTEAAAGRNVWLVGGGELVGQFLDEGLLDEIQLSLAPVVLGSGKPLLPRRRTTPMRLTSTHSFAGGAMVHLVYSLR